MGSCPVRRHALPVDQKRGEHFGIAVFLRVEVEHEVDQRPFQVSSQPPVECETRPGDLRAAGKVQDVQALADLPVRPRRKGEPRLFPPDPNDRIVIGASAAADRLMRNVGERQQDRLEFFVGQTSEPHQAP